MILLHTPLFIATRASTPGGSSLDISQRPWEETANGRRGHARQWRAITMMMQMMMMVMLLILCLWA